MSDDNLSDEELIKMVDDDFGAGINGEITDEPIIEIQEDIPKIVPEEKVLELDQNAIAIEQLRAQNADLNARLNRAEKAKEDPIEEEIEEEIDHRTDYEKALDSVELTAEQKKQYNEYEEFDEDQAFMFKKAIQQDKIIESLLDVQETQKTREKERAAEEDRIAQEKQLQEQEAITAKEKAYNDVISQNDNLKKWQENEDDWAEVNQMYAKMLKDEEFKKLPLEQQMFGLEKRYSAFVGIDIPEVDDNVDDEIKIAEESVNMPNSLSSVSGGDADATPGRVVISDSTSGAELQAIMDGIAKSDDPDAIAKFLTGGMDIR